MIKKTTRMRELIRSPRIAVAPGVWDGYTVRLVEKMGFSCAAISGAGVANSVLGKPDVGLMSMTDNLNQSRNIAHAVEIPVTADIDTGYGNAVNVYYTVQRFEEAGVAGVNIEDQVWPKRCGHIKGKQVISLEEMVKKIEAAVKARRDSDFIITARTDAAAIGGVKEAIRRANAYADAGADMIFPDALLSVEDIKHFVEAVKIPVSINMGLGIRRRPTTPLLAISELEAMGVARVSLPRLLQAASLMGMQRALAVVKESIAAGKVIERPDLVVKFQEIPDLMGLQEYLALEQEFLTEDVLAEKYSQKNL